MKKFLTYFFLAISSLLVIAAFMTATTYLQLIVASIVYPGLVYLILRAFPRRVALVPMNTNIAVSTANTQPFPNQTNSQPLSTNTVGSPGPPAVADSNKRDFLKMIGAAGLSFFLFQLFNRRGFLLGGSPSLPLTSTKLEDSSGQKVDPATRQPTDGYRISEIDDSIVSYYGFINNSGGWFIMQEDSELVLFATPRVSMISLATGLPAKA